MGAGKNRRERAIALAVGALLVLVTLEAALRVVSAVYWRDEGRPGADPGYLLPDRARACGECPRILVVGDSYTYGVGAWKGHDYPSQLERLLNTPARAFPVVVVNGGVGAANSTFVLERLETYLGMFRPNLVLILAGGTNAVNFSRYYAFAHPSGLSAWLDDFAYHVRIFRFVRYCLADLSTESDRQSRDPFAGVSRGPWVDRYVAWLQKHPVRGHHLDATRSKVLGRLKAGDWLGVVERLETHQAALSAGQAWALAFAYRELGRYPDALRLHKAALHQNPRDPLHLCGAGMCLLHEGLVDVTAPGRLEDAARHFRLGIEAAPSFAGNYCGLGTTLEIQQDREAALYALKRGIEIDPKDSRCYPSLIAISEMLGKHDQVAAFLKAFQKRSAMARWTATRLWRERKAASAWIRHDIDRMIDACRARGIPVMLQDYPIDTGANDVLWSVAHDRNVPIVRHRAVFRAMLEAGTPLSELFVPDMHCSDRGYEVMAWNICRAFDEKALFANPGGDGSACPRQENAM